MSDNNRIHQAMEVMSRTLGKELESLGPAAEMKMQSVMQNCYNKSGENPDRFAQCLVDNQKRLTEVMQGFQFKMVFLSRNVQECLAKGKSVNDCGEQAAKIGKNVIDSTNKQLSKF